MGDFVLLNGSKLVNINGAVLLDSVGNEANTYRLYKTVSGENVLWCSKAGVWISFDKPDPAIVAKINSMRPKDDPRYPYYVLNQKVFIKNRGIT